MRRRGPAAEEGGNVDLRTRLAGLDPKDGSAEMEAAMIWPLIVLIMAAMISRGFGLYDEVRSSCAEGKTWAENKIGSCLCESIMRTEWFMDYE